MKIPYDNYRSTISSLWIFILFNIIFRDLHQFLNQGEIEAMMRNTITQSELLFFALVLEIPIAMIVVSRLINDQWNKWVNLLSAILMALGMLALIPEADLDDIFFTSMQLIALIAISWLAWSSKSKRVSHEKI